MAHKDKVKELVGGGLNAYHTKALQQMDRIEKKNKEQNHKISILTNELDNDYLTKTEEGSVISLEHSKEGMVYLDELQGNTLVNYCIDGSKEMTLNGDIDVEGTFVTTTEGVDGGKIDVMCEGNTLVNLVKGFNEKETVLSKNYELLYSKPNTTYTVLLDIELTSNAYVGFLKRDNNWSGGSSTDTISTSGTHIIKFTPTDEDLRFRVNGGSSQVIVNNLVVLEGNYTNKEIPTEYFEGMKSVGQDDENGHKIEILSRNKNYINNGENYSNWGTDYEKTNNGFILDNSIMRIANNNNSLLDLKHGETYVLSMDVELLTTINESVQLYMHGMGVTPRYGNRVTKSGKLYWQFVHDSKFTNIGVYFQGGEIVPARAIISNVMLEKGSIYSNYIKQQYNKKEISLNEPLRGLLSGHKDKFIKIGGKWFVERNTNEVVLNSLNGLGEISEVLTENGVTTSRVYISYDLAETLLPKIRKVTGNMDIMSDKLVYKKVVPNIQQENQMAIGKTDAGVSFRLQGENLQECETWLSNNPIKIVYALTTPTYEPIEDVELITYLDTTHISNNSIIPCNMKIKNSGYNAIIKPSTLYTIALDTNKSGTIGMNLGGVKGETTNNVLTLTTPSTLSDDSLRIYGKGLKGSKVRLLEGNKTNWIPSFFEGMKSSFEDKFDATDNTYKMEILSKNKNVFNINEIENTFHSYLNGMKFEKLNSNSFRIYNTNGNAWQNGNSYVKLKPNTTYKVSYTMINKGSYGSLKMYRIYNASDYTNKFVYFDNIQTTGTHTFNKIIQTDYSGIVAIQLNSSRNIAESNEVVFEDFYISEISTDFIYSKSNKIQFSSIEPLRKWDRFIFKDGQLMIERYSRELILEPNARYWNRKVTYPKPNVSRLEANGIFDFDLENIFDWSHRFYVLSNNFIFKEGENKPNYIVLLGETNNGQIRITLNGELSFEECMTWLAENTSSIIYRLKEPIYEEIPFELQKIILEGYENGTLFFDTNIPPTSTVTYAGETPIVKATKLNKTEVSSNTDDINDNIIPYLMDMDYRVVCLQLATEEIEGGVSMARLFGGAYEMLKRDILSKRLSRQEYGYRLADYFNAGKLTEEQVRELEDLR